MVDIRILNEESFTGSKTFEEELDHFMNLGFILVHFNTCINKFGTMRSVAFLQKDKKRR